ncbi:uncharacterized protein AMSG_01101, partial [Thecamonas trahens ATCC 50062]
MDCATAADVSNVQTLLDGSVSEAHANIPALPLAALRAFLGAVMQYPAHAGAAADDGNTAADAALRAWLEPSGAFVFFDAAATVCWPDATPGALWLAPVAFAEAVTAGQPAAQAPAATAAATDLDLDLVQAERNQYSIGAISSCTIMAMEAALQLLRGESPTIDLVDAILDLGAAYTSPMQLSADEVVSQVDRYSCSLVMGRMAGLMAHTVAEAMPMLEAAATAGPAAAVITKAPESVMLAYLPATDVSPLPLWLLFDSHARPTHPGAAFLSTTSAPAMRAYLGSLFPTVDLGDDLGIQGAMLNMADVTLFSLAAECPEELPSIGVSSLAAAREAEHASHHAPPSAAPAADFAVDALDPSDQVLLFQYLETQNLPPDTGFYTHDELARHYANAKAWFG